MSNIIITLLFWKSSILDSDYRPALAYDNSYQANDNSMVL